MLKRQKSNNESPKLYLIGTPIGNFDDMTFRAIETLKQVDLIYCEDTRITSKLLSHFDIHTPLKAYNVMTENDLTEGLINQIKNGKNISLEFQEKSYEFEIMLNTTEYIIETRMNFLLFIHKKLLKNKKLFSMILYGKPGIGKTTIATAIINELGLKHRFLNAVINNKKDFDIVVEEAKMYGGIVVIMDEIHRLNKDKQDLLLPQLESGLITLIGMTTSNPYHAINPAIRSRCQIFELHELSNDDIEAVGCFNNADNLSTVFVNSSILFT